MLRSFRLPALLLFLLLPACMLSPSDDWIVARLDARLDFMGFHVSPDKEVRIEAFNPGTRVWELLGTTRSATRSSAGNATDPHAYFDTDIYQWTRSLSLSPRQWQPGAVSGYRAQVRATTPNNSGGVNNLLTVEQDWGACYEDNKTAAGFSRNCASDHSPYAFLYTADYCNERPTHDWIDHHDTFVTLPSCSAATIHMRSLDHAWDHLEARVDFGGASETVSCGWYQGFWESYNGFYSVACELRFGAGHLFADAAAFRAAAGRFRVNLRGEDPDATTCSIQSEWEAVPWASPALGENHCASMPTPPPPPGDGPDLVVYIDEHDGYWAPLQICNEGNRAVTNNRFYLDVRGDTSTWNHVSMESYLPITGLAAGQCWQLPDAYVGSYAGLSSLSVEAFVDATNTVAERNELNNRAGRYRRP